MTTWPKRKKSSLGSDKETNYAAPVGIAVGAVVIGGMYLLFKDQK